MPTSTSSSSDQQPDWDAFDADVTPPAELVDAVMREDDENDPWLERYQQYDAEL
jgi:hypothetical protein